MEIEESYGASFERLESYHSPREYSSAGSHLVWEDLTVVLPNLGKGAPKRLLNGLSGFAEPGRVLAIMGPSGSGKSTLLDSFAAYPGNEYAGYDATQAENAEEEYTEDGYGYAS